MGLEQAAPEVNPGLSSSANLVPGTQDYTIAPKAVENMRAALKDGFITASDIGERFSHREGIKKQLQTQLLQNELKKQQAEADLIQPRADLAQAQTGAQLTLLPKQTDLASTQLTGAQGAASFSNQQQPKEQQLSAGQTAQALQEMGTGMDPKMVRQLDTTWGLDAQYDPQTGTVTNPEEVHKNLRRVSGAMNGMRFAEEMSKRITQQPQTINGQKVMVPVWNGSGTAVDPNTRATLDYFQSRGASMIQPKGTTTAAPAASAPAASGAATDTNGNFITEGTNSPEAAAKLREEMAKDKRISSFTEAAPQYEQLLLDEKTIASKTPEQWQADPGGARTFDTHLAFNFFKVLHPETRVTEQNFKEIENISPNALGADGQPLGARVANLARDTWNKLLHETQVNPRGRQSLVDEGKAAFQGYINAAKPVLDGYGQAAEKQGVDRSAVILPQWQSVLEGKSVAPVDQAPKPAAAPQAASKTYGGKQWALGQTYSDPKTGARWTVTDFDSSGKPILGPTK